MTTTTDLTIIQIPSKPSTKNPCRLIQTPLIAISPHSNDKNACQDFEKELRHVPNLQPQHDPKTFSWPHRHLLGTLGFEIGGLESWKGDYMMYVCLDEKAGLPRNEYLEALFCSQKGRWTSMGPMALYGDAFVFKKMVGSEGGSGYLDLSEEFLLGGRLSGVAEVVVDRLLRYPHRGDWK